MNHVVAAVGLASTLGVMSAMPMACEGDHPPVPWQQSAVGFSLGTVTYHDHHPYAYWNAAPSDALVQTCLRQVKETYPTIVISATVAKYCGAGATAGVGVPMSEA
jgi:hypothetical protein